MPKSKRAAKAQLEQKLIELVKLRPCIYSVKDINHKNSIVVENAWKFIFEEIGETSAFPNAEACCDMWKGLWSQYLGFKRRLSLTNKSGKGRAGRPNFRHEQSMMYFDDENGNQDETFTNVNENDDPVSPSDLEQILSADSEVNVSPNGTTTVTVPLTTTTPMSTTSAGIPKMTKSRTHQAYGNKSKAEKRSFDEQLIECLKSEPLDEYQHFCSGIAIKLQKLHDTDKKLAIQTQKRIQDVMFDAEMEML